MLWQTWIEAVSLAFNTDLVGTGILVSLILIITIDLLVIMLLKDKSSIPLLVIDFFTVLALVFAQWLPTFTGVVLALIMALIATYAIKERVL